MYSLKYVQSFPDFVTVPRIRKIKYVVWNTFFSGNLILIFLPRTLYLFFCLPRYYYQMDKNF